MMRIKRLAACLLLAFVLSLLLCPCGNAAAADDARYTNPETGYRVWILDEADLLQPGEEEQLQEAMIPITEYGNIFFWTTGQQTDDASVPGHELCQDLCSDDSYGCCVFDIYNGSIMFLSNGTIEELTEYSDAALFTDSVRAYAERGNILECAELVYEQTLKVLQGAEAADAPRYTNPDTGYRVWILDDDVLLTTDEEKQVLEAMIPITEYGNIIFWSTSEPTDSEIRQAKEKRYQVCGDDSSGILAINNTERYITFQSDGTIYEFVSKSYARSVTDNVSGYASNGDYCKCAVVAYGQILTLLHGNRIAQPMKYISLVVIGMMLAFVIVVGLVFGKRFNPLLKGANRAQRVEQGELLVGEVKREYFDSRDRKWVVVLKGIGKVLLHILLRAIIEGIFHGDSDSDSSGGGSSGGGSSGGGGGGSSRF